MFYFQKAGVTVKVVQWFNAEDLPPTLSLSFCKPLLLQAGVLE